MGGLNIETLKLQPVGVKADLDFLVQEGQIRAEAVVCYAGTGSIGLKFMAVREADRAHLAALVTRLRGSSPVPQG
jgi:hypothetical protein